MNFSARVIDACLYGFQTYFMCNPYAKRNYLTNKVKTNPMLSEGEVLGQLDQLINGNENRADWLGQQAQIKKREAVRLSKAGQKKQALMELKRAKKLESMSYAIHKVNENVQNLGDNVQMTSINTQIAGVMNNAMGSIKQMKAQTNINTDEIDNLMDDMQENQDDVTEISNALSRPLDSNYNNDDEELDAELSKELEELCNSEQQSQQLIYIPMTTQQPPQQTIPANQAISLVRKQYPTQHQQQQHLSSQPVAFPTVPESNLPYSARLMAESH